MDIYLDEILWSLDSVRTSEDFLSRPFVLARLTINKNTSRTKDKSNIMEGFIDFLNKTSVAKDPVVFRKVEGCVLDLCARLKQKGVKEKKPRFRKLEKGARADGFKIRKQESERGNGQAGEKSVNRKMKNQFTRLAESMYSRKENFIRAIDECRKKNALLYFEVLQHSFFPNDVLEGKLNGDFRGYGRYMWACYLSYNVILYINLSCLLLLLCIMYYCYYYSYFVLICGVSGILPVIYFLYGILYQYDK